MGCAPKALKLATAVLTKLVLVTAQTSLCVPYKANCHSLPTNFLILKALTSNVIGHMATSSLSARLYTCDDSSSLNSSTCMRLILLASLASER